MLLQVAAAQLQCLGYEAGVWDLMGAVQIARRALDALTGAISSSGGEPDVAEEAPGIISGSGTGHASGADAVAVPPPTA